MSYNGSGTYVPPTGQPVATGTVIQSATFNTLVTDIGNTFNNVLPRDGQASMAGQLKITDGTSSVPGIAFNSEASTGLFRPVQGALALVASGVETLRINNAGRVLLGTTTDDGINALQVNGPAKVIGATTLSSTLNVTGATTVYNTLALNAGNDVGFALNGGMAIQRKAGDALGFLTASLERMRIMAAGNVLIGTATDNGRDKLQVAGSIAAGRPGLQAVIKDNAGTDYGNDLFMPYDGGGSTLKSFRLRTSYNAGAGLFSIASSTNSAAQSTDPSSLTYTPALSVAAIGNVLVGTTTDNGTNKLQVYGPASASAFKAVYNNGPVSAFTASSYWAQPETGSISRAYASGPDASTFGQFEFYTVTSSGANHLGYVVSPSGNLLLGTTGDNGSDKLQVNGTGTFYNTLKLGHNDYGWGNTTQNVLSLLGDGVSGVAPPSQYRFYVTPGFYNSNRMSIRGWDSISGETGNLVSLYNGSLLVGTDTQAGKIVASSAGTLPAFAARGKSASDIAPDISIARSSSSTSVGAAPAIQFDDGTSNNSRMIQAGLGSMQFFGANGGGWTEQMRLDLNGKLLISRTTDDGSGALLQTSSASIGTLIKPTIKGYVEQFQEINPGAAVTLNPNNGTLIEMQVTANATITLPAAAAGVSYTLIVYYQGAYSLSFAGGTSLHWSGGAAPQATSISGKFDKYVFTCGSTYTLAQDGGRNF